MSEIDQIESLKKALTDALQPVSLEIVNESGKHAGHGGWREGVVTHIHVKVASPLFEGKNRVERHRMVMGALAPQLADFLHAVRITIIGCII